MIQDFKNLIDHNDNIINDSPLIKENEDLT